MNNFKQKKPIENASYLSKKQTFIPGETYIPSSGKVFDNEEIKMGIQAVKDGWWTEGRYAQEFENQFSKLHGVKYISLCNSGSSANLIAISALFSKDLGKRSLKPGDEIITVAAGFPTTVNPIIQNKGKPVFIDIDLETRNAFPSMIIKALSKKTKAIILAHTLGNPFDIKKISKIAKDFNLWLIEDCCDSLGSTYNNKPVGTFGDMATFSFYPAHQITMGEGGAVITNNPLIHKNIRQFRDWGRDCWCETGKDNTCGKRFNWKLGHLPLGYDHKYIYSKIGYNLKITDIQAAIGLAQLKKLPQFIKKRKVNFQAFYNFFLQYKEYFILPKWENESDPSWFGFMVVIRNNAPFSRLEIVNYLESEKIGTRSLFGGNLLLHPAYQDILSRTVGNLENSNKITNDGFWIGVYPGITSEMRKYIINKIKLFIEKKEKK